MRYVIIRVIQWWCAVVVNFCGSSVIFWYYKRPPVCYKKYLGPDWVPDYNWRNAGCVIANHTTFLDSATNSIQQLSSFVAKYEAQSIMGIGNILRASQCLILNRDSKESKKLIQEQITKRIKDGEETNIYDPLIIFPEGGTTNGKYLINFKRGAFMGLGAVFPKIHK